MRLHECFSLSLSPSLPSFLFSLLLFSVPAGTSRAFLCPRPLTASCLPESLHLPCHWNSMGSIPKVRPVGWTICHSPGAALHEGPSGREADLLMTKSQISHKRAPALGEQNHLGGVRPEARQLTSSCNGYQSDPSSRPSLPPV